MNVTNKKILLLLFVITTLFLSTLSFNIFADETSDSIVSETGSGYLKTTTSIRGTIMVSQIQIEHPIFVSLDDNNPTMKESFFKKDSNTNMTIKNNSFIPINININQDKNITIPASKAYSLDNQEAILQFSLSDKNGF